MPLTNLPLKGTADWLPEEFQIRKYIFSTWRQVCESFGYQEYLTPLLEPAELYQAKSGADVGGAELTTLTDRAGRLLAIRPEMTPSVTRLVTRIYASSPKPLRLFSIANFFRNENPQRGRNREFWQLNFDLFGSNFLAADLEILQLAIEIMLAFHPPAGSFTLKLNDRRLIEAILPPTTSRQELVRLLDKHAKLPPDVFKHHLSKLGLATAEISRVIAFMSLDNPDEFASAFPDLAAHPGFTNCQELISRLSSLGYGRHVSFQPNIIRGFDYYDGLVFELFDNHPDNSRSLFGGGRYNGLAGIFGHSSFPAVGAAPGDETTRLFLQSWQLIPKFSPPRYYLPLLHPDVLPNQLATRLRAQGHIVAVGLQPETLSDALRRALKQGYTHLVIYGPAESATNQYHVKDLLASTQITHRLSD